MGPVAGALAHNDRPVFQRHRVKVIDHLEEAGKVFLAGFLDLLFHAIDDLFHFGLGLFHALGPVDAGDVGGVVEAEGGVVAEEPGYGQGVRNIDEQRRLVGWRIVGKNLQLHSRHTRFNPGLDLFNGFHPRVLT